MHDEYEQILDDIDAETEPFEQAAAFARDVEVEARRIRVREAARDKITADKAGDVPPFDADLLADILARPAPPLQRVGGLIPSDAATEVVAARKTGKTTLMLGLTRCLLTGEDFLGRFPVRPLTGRVGFLNFEVSAAQLARWADDAGVPHDRLYLVNLRGRRNPLAQADDREQLAEQLRAHQVESLFVDPFSRAYHGKSQNDPGEVAAWLSDLDRFARGDAGVSDLILSAHAGWDGERTRGASALEDWADVIVTLVRDRDDDQVRYLRAEGRDVLVDEDRLDYDPAARALSMAGSGSRKATAKARHVEDLVPAVVEVVERTPGVTGYGLTKELRAAGQSFQHGDEIRAVRMAVDRQLLRVEAGPRNSKMYYLSPTYPDLPPPTPTGTGADLPRPPLYRRGGQRGGEDTDLPQPSTSPVCRVAAQPASTTYPPKATPPAAPGPSQDGSRTEAACPGCTSHPDDPPPSGCETPDVHTQGVLS
jgi:AAA domain